MMMIATACTATATTTRARKVSFILGLLSFLAAFSDAYEQPTISTGNKIVVTIGGANVADASLAATSATTSPAEAETSPPDGSTKEFPIDDLLTTLTTNETTTMNETTTNDDHNTTVSPSEEITEEDVPDEGMTTDSPTTAKPTPAPISTVSISITIPPPTTAPPTTPNPTTLAPTPLPTTQQPTPIPTPEPTPSPTTPEPTTPAPTQREDRNCIQDPVTNEEIQTLRSAIQDFIEDESGTNFPAKFVRLGFHDCVGGCDGCVDMSDPENAGLEVPIRALEGIVAEFENNCISRADIWATAALVGAEHSQNNIDFPLEWIGRRNCDAEDPMNAPSSRQMPSADMDTNGLLDFFWTEFGFQEQQVVALMGAHSIGRVDRDNSGFVGRGWDNDNEVLDNNYYRQLDTDVRWRQVNQPQRHQWEGGRGGSGDADEDGIIMLNVDIALVRDFSQHLEGDGDVNCRFRNRGGGGGGNNNNNNNNPVCPNAERTIGFVDDYRNDNSRFLNDFRDVYSRLLVQGYPTDDGCDTSNGPCPFPGSFSAVSRRSNGAASSKMEDTATKERTTSGFTGSWIDYFGY